MMERLLVLLGWVVICEQLVAQAIDCGVFEPVPGEDITYEVVATDLAGALDIKAPPGDLDRVFVATQGGVIRIIRVPEDLLEPTPFLDISSRVVSGGERGLLGFAFHPQYDQNGYFFVNYTRSAAKLGDTVISRFSVSPDDPNEAHPASEEIILVIAQPFGNHNAGQLAFGPLDGFLYVGTGDGGGGCDDEQAGQDGSLFLGKMLRIDVNNLDFNVPRGTPPYDIPPDNPFVGDPTVLDEVWSMGLRNPYRYAFDSLTGDLYIGDVGQYRHEEISFQPGTSSGGENFEWAVREGVESSTVSGCAPPAFGPGAPRGPIIDYLQFGDGPFTGNAVIGGEVYRGCRMPDLHGRYFFGDNGSGAVGSVRYEFDPSDPDKPVPEAEQRVEERIVGSLASFGVDGRGEIYAALLDGKVLRLVSASQPIIRPTAAFTLTPAIGDGPLEVHLDGSTSTAVAGSSISSFEWDLGDGTIESGEIVSHTYDGYGVFPIDLTVIDDRRLSATTSGDVFVRLPLGDVAPWTQLDVGGAEILGAARFLDDAIQLFANGRDIGGRNDGFYFVNQEFDGSVTLTARLADLTARGGRSRSGVMLRVGTETDAPHAAMLIETSPIDVRFRFVFRKAVGEDTLDLRGLVATIPNAWVRLERAGDVFIGSYSEDGESWFQLGRVTLDLPVRLLGGVVATSRDNQRDRDIVVAQFADVQAGVVSFLRGDCNNDDAANFADAMFILEFLFGTASFRPTCVEACNVNGDSLHNIADAIYMLVHLFASGPPPFAPYPDCALDPRAGGETLGCSRIGCD